MRSERNEASIPSLGTERVLEGGTIAAFSVPFLSVEGLKPDTASSQRTMGMGLSLSILFHIVVVAVILRTSIMPMGRDESESLVTIELVSPPPSAEPEQPVTAPVAAPEPPKPAKPEQPKPIFEKPKVPAPAVKRPPAPRQTEEAQPMAQPEPASAAVSMADANADTAPPASPAAPAAPPASHASGQEDPMQAYARTLWAQIIGHKPRGIRFQGTVVLSFSLSAGGDLLSAEISRSSGMGSLDRAALGALKDAAPFPPPPAGGNGGALSFTIPFTFQ